MIDRPTVSMIAAIGAKTRALGKANKLLWHLPSDLQFFRDTTKGHPVIMGRKTFESIGRPLPDRWNVVVTRNPSYMAEGVTVFNSIDDALQSAFENGNQEVFIIGGADIYTQALGKTDRLYLTLIDDQGDGADVFFPEYENEFSLKEILLEGIECDLKFRRVIFERKS